MSSTSLLNTKCSICGAPLVFPAGKEEVFCEFCLRPNARPKSEANETTLMKYANERRNLGEFDEAADAYRQVLRKNIGEHEARWGLLLCKYGAMYVEDAASGERLMTCRRVVSTLMRAEPDYKICCEQAGEAVRASYERDAAYIDAVQAEIRRIRAVEPPYDVFICYKETGPDGGRTRDSVLAQEICARMTARGFRMFYAPESLKQKSGANYEAAIFAALTDARVMLILGTRRDYFESTWVRSEWKRYLEMMDAGEEKLVVPMYRDLDPGIDLPVEFRMRYLQAMNMADVGFLYDLEALLEKVFKRQKNPKSTSEPHVDRRDLLNAMFMVQDGEFAEAVEALRAIIRLKPDCAEAHLGLCMARAGVRNEEELPGIQTSLKKSNDFKRAYDFAGEEMRARLKQYVEAQKARFEREKAEREAGARAREERKPGPTAAEKQNAPSQSADIKRLIHDARSNDIQAQCRLAEMYDTGTGVPENKQHALAWYRLAAKNGHAQSQYRLGRMYAEGDGVPADMAAAVNWYRQAVQNGHTGAQNDLGQLYYKGDGVNKSLDVALRLFRRSSDQGYAPAMYNLGMLYNGGEGVDRNPDEALRLIGLSADEGYAPAQYQLGRMYHAGQDVAWNRTEAVRLYRLAAEQGYAPAQVALGKLYCEGAGVEQDDAEAFRLLHLAAEQGLADAQDLLGSLYYNGRGVKKDANEAAHWYELAVRQNHAFAQYHFGCLYYVGEGVPRDAHAALKLFRLASEQGIAAAKCCIGDIYFNGDGVVKNRTEAIRWYQASAMQGYAQAQYNLGNLYNTGAGLINRVGATRWYLKAAKQGHLQAQLVLASMYYQGSGIPKSLEDALKWYLTAAGQGAVGAQYTVGLMLYNGEGTAADRNEALRWLMKAVEQGSGEARRFVEAHYDAAQIPEPLQSDPPVGSAGDTDSEEGEIADDWERILQAIDDGSARDRYAVGSWKALSLGKLGRIEMRLAGFDLDERADGQGRAATTWIARTSLAQIWRMNPALDVPMPPFLKGTGAIGGWEKCEARRRLNSEVLPELPPVLRQRLVTVMKQHGCCNTRGYAMKQRTMDALWIPALEEIDGATPLYSAGVSENVPGQSEAWWLRTALNISHFQIVLSDGRIEACPSENRLGIRIGFCL